MSVLTLILAILALIAGAVAVLEAGGRNWAGWGVIALAIIVLIGRLG